jgi:hypothetical protein
MSADEKHNWIKEQLLKGFKEAVQKAIEKTRYSEYPYIVVEKNGKLDIVKLERYTK